MLCHVMVCHVVSCYVMLCALSYMRSGHCYLHATESTGKIKNILFSQNSISGELSSFNFSIVSKSFRCVISCAFLIDKECCKRIQII